MNVIIVSQVNRLAVLGGSGLHNIVHRIMEQLLTSDMAVMHNWSGVSPPGKRKRMAFRKFDKLIRIIKGRLIFVLYKITSSGFFSYH